MARITEDLIRKCAEHNECEIFSLEELSLHQRNIVKIEHLDRWCRDLKILYLHNNLISKIENLGRLKKLEYVNFTLNNITKIENLEGCESLKKLDFTVNFIGELTSVESLKENYCLEELYLTGNPCVDYEGYREFVLATLPQIKIFDGEKIKPSERITAMQKYNTVRRDILEQQKRYMKQTGKSGNSSPTEDWSDADEPSNAEAHDEKKKPKRPRILFTEDGRPLNINEPKLNFEFIEEEENNCYKLNLGVYRYLSTSLLEADVQPNYVRVLVKGKIFQLHLPKEVRPDSCTSLRSQTTGHLLITMPKVEDILKLKVQTEKKKDLDIPSQVKNAKNEVLEVTSSLVESLSSVVNKSTNHHIKKEIDDAAEKSQKNIPEFFDNPEVPPLI